MSLQAHYSTETVLVKITKDAGRLSILALLAVFDTIDHKIDTLMSQLDTYHT